MAIILRALVLSLTVRPTDVSEVTVSVKTIRDPQAGARAGVDMLNFAFATRGSSTQLSAVTIAVDHSQSKETWKDLLHLDWTRLNKMRSSAMPHIDFLCWYYVDDKELRAHLEEVIPLVPLHISYISQADIERWHPLFYEAPPPAIDQSTSGGQVDYLAHEWKDEDIWSSWRSVARRKNYIPNGMRLENASWRKWWKQRNNLPTASPESLNWYVLSLHIFFELLLALVSNDML